MAKSPGDFTGKQKERLQKEAMEKQQEEAHRLSMITAQENKAKSTEVIDYTQKKKVPPPQPTGPGTQVDPDPVDMTAGGDQRQPREDLTTATGGNTPAPAMDEVIDTTREPEAVTPEPVIVHPESVLIRARYDLPQVTIGHGNHYDFEAGRRYRVPYNAAQHLAERELVDILG